MDAGMIEEMINEFIARLEREFVELQKEITADAQAAAKEVEEVLGVPREEVPSLVFEIADPLGAVAVVQERCRGHTKHIFDMLECLDPEQEKIACAMIMERLRDLHQEISSLFLSSGQ